MKAKDFYITQNGGGTGASCSSSLGVAWFNTSANWGAGASQIGPGTTVHLCGRFNGTAGEQLLAVRGSGTAGHPITIKFENGAALFAPYWSPQGAISANNLSYITVDGGANGVIQNTANGTGLAYHQNSRAIYMMGCANCTVQHLTMANIYVRRSNSDMAPTQTDLNCIYWLKSNNFTISYVTCHDAGWAFAGYGNNFTLANSIAYNVDHGLAFGPAGTVSGFSIHDNHIYNYSNWDSAQNSYHHDGLHIWGQNGGRVTNGVIYNNRFDGDSGVNITAHIYLQDSIQDVAVYNNIFVVPATRTINVLWFAAGTNNLPGGIATNNSAYNNFISAGGHGKGTALFIQGQHNFTAVNNVLIGGQANISFQFGGSLSGTGIDHNLYLDLQAAANDPNGFGYLGQNFKTLDAWRGACHCDTNSRMVSLAQIDANTAGQLLAGSVGINAGRNLMSMATGNLLPLAHDAIGTQRPSGGTWDIGAFQTVNGRPRVLAPTGLTATVK
ncbi:MAG TPA: choice-of-anchor Q domain-containing protein [Candidatus Acidoferrales bacterium]|nr:choice-of-anchor Q domain-containing protein [Candidatus Acidoferrales bacterium]